MEALDFLKDGMPPSKFCLEIWRRYPTVPFLCLRLIAQMASAAVTTGDITSTVNTLKNNFPILVRRIAKEYRKRHTRSDGSLQTVIPTLHQQGWQRRHLEWEFKLNDEAAEVERTLVEVTINALESFLRSSEVQQVFIKEVVQGTLAETTHNRLHSVAIRHLIERKVLVILSEQKQ